MQKAQKQATVKMTHAGAPKSTKITSDQNAARDQNSVEVAKHLVKTDPNTLSWGLVATVKSALMNIAGFAAYHLELGADQITLYLDDPHQSDVDFLQRHPRLQVIACTPVWWQTQKQSRHKTHQLRQIHNATQAYHGSQLDWLAHIDVDEFILTGTDIAGFLASVPAQDAVLQMSCCELLAPINTDEEPRFFKMTPKQANLPPSTREDLYPTFGTYLRGGFISHIDGKLFARTGLKDVRFDIHTLLSNDVDVTNRTPQNALRLGHAHASSWETFKQHLGFRRAKGSYRKRGKSDFLLADIIDYLVEDEGEDGDESGLKQLFREVNEATPDLLTALQSRGMLIEHPLDLEAKIVKVFGELPPEIGNR